MLALRWQSAKLLYMKKISLWLAMMALGVVSATAQNLISAIGNFENAKGWDASIDSCKSSKSILGEVSGIFCVS